jgi:hypothetical protein
MRIPVPVLAEWKWAEVGEKGHGLIDDADQAVAVKPTVQGFRLGSLI